MSEIIFEVQCAHCKAGLKGLSLSGVCRECGRSVGATLDLRLLDPAEMAVIADRSCAGCGYNLRSLSMGATCPECAEPVAGSLRPHELWAADRRWLLGVRLGVTMLLISMIGIPAIAIVFSSLESLAPSGPLLTMCNVFGGLAFLVLAVLAIVGLLSAASREADRSFLGESHWPHTLARVTILLPVALFVGSMILNFISVAVGITFPMVIMAITWLCMAILSLCPICTAICLRRAARRSTRQSLASATTVWVRVAACGMVMGIAYCAVVLLLLVSGGSSPAWWVTLILGGLSIVGAISALLLYIAGIVGLVTYRRLLNEAITPPQLPASDGSRPVSVPTANDA